MKKVFVFALILSFLFCLFSQIEKKPDFREAFWGMSKDEVKKIETAKLKPEIDKSKYHDYFDQHEEQGPDNLIYEDYLFYFPCEIKYCFINNKLYRGFYLFYFSDGKILARVYEIMKAKLTEKYGKPKEDNSPNLLLPNASWEKPGALIFIGSLGKKLSLGYNHPDFIKMEKEKEEDKI